MAAAAALTPTLYRPLGPGAAEAAADVHGAPGTPAANTAFSEMMQGLASTRSAAGGTPPLPELPAAAMPNAEPVATIPPPAVANALPGTMPTPAPMPAAAGRADGEALPPAGKALPAQPAEGSAAEVAEAEPASAMTGLPAAVPMPMATPAPVPAAAAAPTAPPDGTQDSTAAADPAPGVATSRASAADAGANAGNAPGNALTDAGAPPASPPSPDSGPQDPAPVTTEPRPGAEAFHARLQALFAPAERGAVMAEAPSGAILLPGAAAAPAGAAGPGAAASPIPTPGSTDAWPTLEPLAHRDTWAQGLGERLLFMADKGLQSATVRLQPEHLGPMEIRIHVDDEGAAQVFFSAQHAQTREALEQALPRLRDMFAEQGLSLGETGVDSGRHAFAGRGFGGMGREDAPGAWPSRQVPGDGDAPTVLPAWQHARGFSPRRIDVYA